MTAQDIRIEAAGGVTSFTSDDFEIQYGSMDMKKAITPQVAGLIARAYNMGLKTGRFQKANEIDNALKEGRA
jgi:hypothetical protein